MKKDSGEFNNVIGKGISNCAYAFCPTMGWIRVGDYVTIAGRVQVSAPALGIVQFTLPTPLPTDFTNTMGTGGNFSDSCGNSGIFEVSNANNLIFTFTNEDDNYSDFMFSGIFKLSKQV